eukprot:TRINITY_DN3103_c0_g1_i1.p2 TRINITY_DN3103_c0_g1~~TRINITY_DN3103_c0_g1_i1.p2  ORF type:complete len:392 (-),score=117.19 TRINITY_DN3103_c0_g1_i1:87-1262(-)
MGGSSSKSKNAAAAEVVDEGAAVSSQNGDDTNIKVSKTVLDWGLEKLEGNVPLHKAIIETITITNNNHYPVKYRFEPCFPREFQLNFIPEGGEIKARKAKVIKAKLTVHSKVNLNFKTTLNIEGVGTHFLTAKLRCETGVFGVDPTSLDMEDDEGVQIPIVLGELKRAFLKNGGIEQEGVFRLAGEQNEVKQVKQQLNTKNYENLPVDVNCTATLIKIWYRELPTPVLNSLPAETIFLCEGTDYCVQAFKTLPEPNKTLLNWLLDLLLMVACNRRVNKMTAQNLAIVVAPNLYDALTPDPIEALAMSQKAAQFVHNLLVWKVQMKEEEVGHAVDAELNPEEAAPKPLMKDAVSQTSNATPEAELVGASTAATARKKRHTSTRPEDGDAGGE